MFRQLIARTLLGSILVMGGMTVGTIRDGTTASAAAGITVTKCERGGGTVGGDGGGGAVCIGGIYNGYIIK